MNLLQAARFWERHAVSRAKSDDGDRHVLADVVRTHSHQPAIRDPHQLPAWYPAVQQVQELAAGDAQGVGTRVRLVIKGRLPMRLAFEGTIVRVDPPRELELQAMSEHLSDGPLAPRRPGRGRRRPAQ